MGCSTDVEATNKLQHLTCVILPASGPSVGCLLLQCDSVLKIAAWPAQELILFSRADLERSIPSMVDGLKPGQRKIMFSCFKRNLKDDIKVLPGCRHAGCCVHTERVTHISMLKQQIQVASDGAY